MEFVENKGIKIQFDTEIEEKITACDPDKIERIMLNLLSNAIKFTNPNGNIQINVYDGESDIKIVVKDDGIGIPKEKLDSVFGKFIQVDKSLCRNHEGSGLGLSIAKSFVEMHGGTIKVESEYGKGTEFIILLPITLVKDNMDAMDYVAVAESHVQRVNIEFSDIYS
ncbi:Adaptive-response sensory-kinase SasA [bioreactor metagenome]|uniref:histidine kinase n=1 Tax=bioreactor metagenome TaxID=1076179 RepID=A0A645HGU2_9ZZZZ